MADTPSDKQDPASEQPAPELLKAQEDNDAQPEPAQKAPVAGSKPEKKSRHGSYRPSHKATFIGLAVVIAIIAINAVVIILVVKAQSKSNAKATQGQVTVNQAALDKLGVNQTAVGDKGIKLTVNPDASFHGNVDIAGKVSIAGQLQLNNTFSASNASLAVLQADKATMTDLNVSGDGTLSNLNLRKDLGVAGTTRLQGPVLMSQLLTVTNSVNISGNLAVGGTLSVNSLHVSSFIVDNTITIGGHVITRGLAPGVSAGSAVGSNGTVSISGNDMSGTVAVNIGVGASAGNLANVSFRMAYSNTPHVVITPIGGGVTGLYINRSASGFSINDSGALAPGGYAFDYIVEQ